jgi:O-6-methylguanine DNA methyltransferase
MKATSKPDKRSSFRTVESKTTWGILTLTLDSGNAVALDLPPLRNTPSKPFTMERFQSLDDLTEKFPAVGLPKGTGFQRAVWNEIKKIPRGQTRTYGEIAAAIGHPKAVRAVGTACGANPLPVFIPCHRVTAKNGLGGFGGGLPWKILLLKTEGVL